MKSKSEVERLFRSPLKELIRRAAEIHRQSFNENEVQTSALLSIKTGGCPENCSYCPQSAHYKTGTAKHGLLDVTEVVSAAARAQASGATRFCMGAAWRDVKDGPEFDRVLEMIEGVNDIGLEVCCTLGMVTEAQARRLKDAGLYAYNHNLDSSREFYSKIISTRTYDDRLRTIANVRRAGLTVCTGGILGMGETDDDRIEFLRELANLDPAPESVTINALIPIAGTPLAHQNPPSGLDIARVVATARCLMPQSMIRLSAGRKTMTDEAQFLCFLAGANSIFFGQTLLTADNPTVEDDVSLFERTNLEQRTRPVENQLHT